MTDCYFCNHKFTFEELQTCTYVMRSVAVDEWPYTKRVTACVVCAPKYDKEYADRLYGKEKGE